MYIYIDIRICMYIYIYFLFVYTSVYTFVSLLGFGRAVSTTWLKASCTTYPETYLAPFWGAGGHVQA